MQFTFKKWKTKYRPEFKSRPGLKALLFTVVESRSQLTVLDTLVLKFPSNLKQQDRISSVYLVGFSSKKNPPTKTIIHTMCEQASP